MQVTVMADAAQPTIRTFQVFPDVPEPLQSLLELSKNFWWVWHPEAAELLRRVDRELWDRVYHNPVKLLGSVSQDRLQALAQDEGYLAQLARVFEAFQQHMQEEGWFHEN